MRVNNDGPPVELGVVRGRPKLLTSVCVSFVKIYQTGLKWSTPVPLTRFKLYLKKGRHGTTQPPLKAIHMCPLKALPQTTQVESR